MPSVSAQDLSKSFGTLRVLEALSFTANEGEILCLFGPSGCGKTTVLRIVAGLETPDSGVVRIGDRGLHRFDRHGRVGGDVGRVSCDEVCRYASHGRPQEDALASGARGHVDAFAP